MTLLRISALALLLGPFTRADDLTEDLLAATRKGDLAQVKALLDKGAPVDSKTPYGQTPLFFACDRGYTEIVKLLIDRGADVNVEDTFYHATPITWAAQKKHNDILLLLLDHGAKSPAMVLMMGVQSGNLDFVKMALAKGVDKPALSQALAAAMKGKNEQIVSLLKESGATPPEPIKTIELDPTTLQKYVGTYTGGRGGTEFEVIFVIKGAGLSGTIAGQPPLTFAASDQTHFHSVEFEGVNLEFTPDGLSMKQGSQVIEFKRKAGTK